MRPARGVLLLSFQMENWENIYCLKRDSSSGERGDRQRKGRRQNQDISSLVSTHIILIARGAVSREKEQIANLEKRKFNLEKSSL